MMSDSYFQVNVSCDIEKFAFEPAELSLAGSTNYEKLSQLAESLLTDYSSSVELDFLLNDILVRDTIDVHVSQNDLGTEQVLKLVIIKKLSPPELEGSSQVPDWLSCISSCRNNVVYGCYDGHVRLVRSSQYDHPIEVTAHSQPIKCVDCLSDNDGVVVVSGGRSIDISVHKVTQSSTEETILCQGHSEAVNSVSIEPTGKRFCSGGADSMFKIWSLEPPRDSTDSKTTKKKAKVTSAPSQGPLVTLAHHQDGITCVKWCEKDQNEILTCSMDGTLKVIDINSLKSRSSFSHQRPFNFIDQSIITGLVATASFDTKIRVYDTRVEQDVIILKTLSGHGQKISSLRWCPTSEHHLVSGSFDKVMKLWDTRSPAVPLYDISISNGKILACEWLAEDGVLLFGGEETLLHRFIVKI